jgi:ubiquitin-like-conjugating enzyme ATG3
MKKVIERMNNSVVAQQLAAQSATVKASTSGSSAASGGAGAKKGKWLFRRASGREEKQMPSAAEGEEEVEGMRVDFYLVVFLKFIASIVPTIEVDSTTAF